MALLETCDFLSLEDCRGVSLNKWFKYVSSVECQKLGGDLVSRLALLLLDHTSDLMYGVKVFWDLPSLRKTMWQIPISRKWSYGITSQSPGKFHRKKT